MRMNGYMTWIPKLNPITTRIPRTKIIAVILRYDNKRLKKKVWEREWRI